MTCDRLATCEGGPMWLMLALAGILWAIYIYTTWRKK